MLFEFAEPADEYEKLWADAETIILDELSDEESSDSAIEFCHCDSDAATAGSAPTTDAE